MPGITGLELLNQLRTRRFAIPSLLITGYHDDQIERQALDLGVMGVVDKPMQRQRQVNHACHIESGIKRQWNLGPIEAGSPKLCGQAHRALAAHGTDSLRLPWAKGA